MSENNLTETAAHEHAITMFVPLFEDNGKEIGIHIRIFEQFGAWTFTMHSDLNDCDSLIGELFDGLCRAAGLRRRITCAIDLELGRRDGDYEFLCSPCEYMGRGEFFTLAGAEHLIATAFIPYWQQAAKKILKYNRNRGFNDTCNRAITALGKWLTFDNAQLKDCEWHEQWRDVNCAYDRKRLIRGDNWKAETHKRPLERFEENSSKSAWKTHRDIQKNS